MVYVGISGLVFRLESRCLSNYNGIFEDTWVYASVLPRCLPEDAMPTARLSDRIAGEAVLPAGKTDLILWDTEVTGFALRVRPTGKSWIVAYRPRGAGRSANMKRLKLASVGIVPRTAAARQLAREALGRVANGVDLLAERRAAQVREKARLGDLLERYDQDLARRNYVNRKTVIAGLRAKMASLLQRDVREITGADLALIVERLEQAGQHGAAQDFRSRARAFFQWAMVKARILKVNPFAGLRKERTTRADRIAKAEHGRALSDVELATVWAAADPATGFGRLLRFYLLTGCRRGEGAGVAWSMLDAHRTRIDLPAAFVKQGRAHAVYVTPALADLLAQCPVDARSDLVFASWKTGRTISGWAPLLRSFAKRCPVVFELHDLRRTFRTGLSRLGVAPDIAELALGHARSDLEATYNKDKREALVREAFERWAAHIETVCAPTTDIFS